MAIQESTQHAQVNASLGIDAQGVRELIVSIRPLNLDYWELYGTRVQLESEGVIPSGTVWPEGVQDRRWRVGRFEYWLRRSRPEGLKGPRRLWVNGDWWFVRCSSRSDFALDRIEDKRRELAAAIYDASPAGKAAASALFSRTIDARKDKGLQSFLRGVVPQKAKPGRKPKVQP